MNKIQTTFQLKTVEEQGCFSGYASVYHVEDAHKDRVMPGAFDAAIKRAQTKECFPKLLWQHEAQNPIGAWTHLKEDSKGLFAEGTLFLEIQKGQEAYALLKRGVVDGLSIGYQALKKRPHQGGFLLESLALMEISLVTFPANTHARVVSVKSEESWVFIERRLNRLSLAMSSCFTNK